MKFLNLLVLAARRRLVRRLRQSQSACDAPGIFAGRPAAKHAQPKLQTMKIYLGAEMLDAELALTAQEEMTGMMFRTNIQETDAMLFVLPYPQRADFWMKNCPESISAAYITPDGVIQEIHHLEKNDTNAVLSPPREQHPLRFGNQGWLVRTPQHSRRHGDRVGKRPVVCGVSSAAMNYVFTHRPFQSVCKNTFLTYDSPCCHSNNSPDCLNKTAPPPALALRNFPSVIEIFSSIPNRPSWALSICPPTRGIAKVFV